MAVEFEHAGVAIAKRVTENCVITDKGEIFFARRSESGRGEKVLVRHPDIFNAISQNLHHILGEKLGWLDDFYSRKPEFLDDGEIGLMRDTIAQFQTAISILTKSTIPESQIREMEHGLPLIVNRYGKVRNRHKERIRAFIENIETLLDKRSRSKTDVVLGLGRLNVAALQRFLEVDSIITGTLRQTKILTEIAADHHGRIVSVHQKLGTFIGCVQKILRRYSGDLEEADRNSLLRIHKAILRKGFGILGTLRGIEVEPYKTRAALSLKQLNGAESLLVNFLETGKSEDLVMLKKKITLARSKLSRLITERRAQIYFRLFMKVFGGEIERRFPQ
jgi:hypothetical protein